MKRASPDFRRAALREMGLAPLWVPRARAAVKGVPEDAPQDAPQDSPQDAPGFRAQHPDPESRGGPRDRIEAVRVSPVHMPIDAALDAAGRGRAIARLDWQQLHEEVTRCQACPLGATRQQAVFGVGDRQPDWLFVGEAPGAEEDQRGEPFVGEAGRLLDNMLKAIGVARGKKVYIANVIKCRPPRNRNPEPDEVARCSPYLLRQIEVLAPRLIVALGRFAAQTLLDTDASVGSLRGRVHALQIGSVRWPVIVTYHPAYLLRSLGDKQKAWVDLCLARQTMQGLEARLAES